MEEAIKFEINIISATDLEQVTKTSSMKVYARVSIAGDPTTEKRTCVDRHGKSNPAWNYVLRYNLGKFVVQQEGIMLVIKLYSRRSFRDRYIGEAYMSIKGLFEHARGLGGGAMVSFPVKKGACVSTGMLNFSYRFVDVAEDELFVVREDTIQAGVLKLLGGLIKAKFGIDLIK